MNKFLIGDLVVIDYSNVNHKPMIDSVGWNLEGTVCKITKIIRENWTNEPCYNFEAVEWKIKKQSIHTGMEGEEYSWPERTFTRYKRIEITDDDFLSVLNETTV